MYNMYVGYSQIHFVVTCSKRDIAALLPFSASAGFKPAVSSSYAASRRNILGLHYITILRPRIRISV